MSRLKAVPLVLIAVAASGWVLERTPSLRCSVSVTPSRADHGMAILLARASVDTVQVGTEDVPDWLAIDGVAPSPPRTVWAQRFVVEDLVGRGEPLLEERGARFSAYLIPWGADDFDCRPGPWTDAARWVDGDFLGVHLARLRRRSEWIEDTPTFDIPYAFSQPYGWEGDTVPSQSSGFGAMTARELFELNRLLTHAPDSLAAVEAFVRWYEEDPLRARKYPASGMSQWWPR